MAIPSYRLDTVTGQLIERLEAARRTWLGQPDAARDGFRRIAVEHIDGVAREQAEVLGDSGFAGVLRREVLETFLPRYARLAVDHNDLEEQGYRAWRRGDPVARVVATGAAFLGALALERIVHHPATLLLFVGALGVPFVPELRAWYYRRRYRGLLQEVVDDMGRIQDEIDRHPVVAEAASEPVATAARPPEREHA